jgi:ABC-2 type transport system ATP-binding protein
MTDASGRIVAAGLTKTFGHIQAVDHLSFTVEPGVVTGFLGPNGAGKTTTLRMLLGLVTPDAGGTSIGGRGYADLPAPSTQVGAVLEATGFHPARSGRDHLRASSRGRAASRWPPTAWCLLSPAPAWPSAGT